jgi:hypothetical protein
MSVPGDGDQQPPPPGPIICGDTIDSKEIREYVVRHTATWTERKETLSRDTNLLKLRLAVAAINVGNAVVFTSNADPRTTDQLESCIRMLTVECAVMKWELRFLTHIYNARSGKAAHIKAAAVAMARLHSKRVEALETVTEADLAEDTQLMAVVANNEGEQSVYRNGGGVKAIADRYMIRHAWEKSVLALCRAGAYC